MDYVDIMNELGENKVALRYGAMLPVEILDGYADDYTKEIVVFSKYARKGIHSASVACVIAKAGTISRCITRKNTRSGLTTASPGSSLGTLSRGLLRRKKRMRSRG